MRCLEIFLRFILIFGCNPEVPLGLMHTYCVSLGLSQMCHKACQHQPRKCWIGVRTCANPGMPKRVAGKLSLCWSSLAREEEGGRQVEQGRGREGGHVGSPWRGLGTNLAFLPDPNPCLWAARTYT